MNNRSEQTKKLLEEIRSFYQAHAENIGLLKKKEAQFWQEVSRKYPPAALNVSLKEDVARWLDMQWSRLRTL